jgi:hypothetical protein
MKLNRQMMTADSGDIVASPPDFELCRAVGCRGVAFRVANKSLHKHCERNAITTIQHS